MKRLRQAATVLLLACSLDGAQPCHAEDLLPGRLFHTPQERAALDGHRAVRAAVVQRAPRGRPLAQPISPERSPELSGFVLRSDGLNSYWLAAPSEPPLKR